MLQTTHRLWSAADPHGEVHWWFFESYIGRIEPTKSWESTARCVAIEVVLADVQMVVQVKERWDCGFWALLHFLALAPAGHAHVTDQSWCALARKLVCSSCLCSFILLINDPLDGRYLHYEINLKILEWLSQQTNYRLSYRFGPLTKNVSIEYVSGMRETQYAMEWLQRQSSSYPLTLQLIQVLFASRKPILSSLAGTWLILSKWYYKQRLSYRLNFSTDYLMLQVVPPRIWLPPM